MDTSSSSQQQHDSSSSRTHVWVRTTHLAEAAAVLLSKSSSRSLVGRKASSEEPTDWGWVKGYLLSDNNENDDTTTTKSSAIADVGEEESSSDVGLDTNKKVKVLIQETNEELASSSVYDGQTFDIDSDGIVIANPWEVAYDNNNDESGYDSYSDDDDNDDGIADPLEEERLPPDDLIDLIHLHEPAVVYALQCRYDMDMIYTSTGPILLALNPFKQCTELYGEETMAKYWEYGERKVAALESGGGEGEGEEENDKKLEPHVYAVADYTFRNMMRHLKERKDEGGRGGSSRGTSRRQLGKNKVVVGQSGGGGGGSGEVTCDQSILVSGESGAGKTVTTKFIMKYLAALSQRSSAAAASGCTSKGGANAAEKTTGGGGVNIEQQVLQSNPILESFGNARTIRNDNSSRFGKFIEIHFTDSGMLVGASIETYLLEKVRLIHQSEGERNYHIYYELLAHMEDEGEDVEEDWGRYFLEDMTVEDFKMTSCSGTFDRRDGVDDYDTYLDLVTAMDTMGFTKSEQTSIMTIISTCLHSSNLTFIDLLTTNNDECELDKTNPSLDAVVTLMGVTIEELNNALCYFTITARNETLTQCLNKQKAEKGMEALIKAMHGALFTYLVRRINESITVPGSSTSQSQQKRAAGSGNRRTRAAGAGAGGGMAAATIGVLDIFGFESFQTNSFEQLCINYCNEALQQQFNLFVLKNEQEEYDREGIQWSFIQFPENQDVLNLIHLKPSGIINILDDQCKTPGTTDNTFASAMYKKCSKHPRFELSSRQEAECLFGIKHYAGSVEYNTVGFVEKNRDELPREATELLLKSKNEFIRHLGTILCSQSGTAPSSTTTTAKSSSARHSSNKGPASNTRPTVGSQFSSQLHTLREKIDITSPHYVRCLKPNDQLTPDNFNPKIIAHQLRCAGVVEAVRVSRLGYPQRYSHGMFTTRYRVLDNGGGGGLKKNNKVDRRGGSGRKRGGGRVVDQLVNAVVKKVDDLGWLDDRVGTNKNSDGEGTTTAVVTATTKDASTVGIQVGKTKVFLRRQAYEMLEKLRTMKMIQSSIVIQTTVRTFVARKKYSTIQQSILVLQCYVRMIIATRVVMMKRRHYRATVLQKSYRKYRAQRQYLSIGMIVKWVQRVQRGRIDRMKYDQLNKAKKACTIQQYYRRYHATKTYRTILASVLVIQCAIRCYIARCVYRNLRSKARDMQFISDERDQFRKEAERLREQLVKSKEKKSVEDTTSKEMIIRLQKELDEVKQRSEEVDRVRTETEEEKKELELALEAEKIKSSESDAQLQLLQKENEELNDNLQRALQTETNVRIEMESLRAASVAAAAAAAVASSQPPSEKVMKELESLQREKNDLSKELDNIRRTSANNEMEMETLRVKAASVERITEELDMLKRERDELQEELKSLARPTEDSSYVVPAEIEILRTKAASADAVTEELEVLKQERDALQEELQTAQQREVAVAEQQLPTSSDSTSDEDDSDDDDDDEKIETLRAKAEMADALAEELDAVRNENEALHEELKRGGEFQQLLDTDSMPAQTMSSVSTITEEELRRENESLRTELTERQQEIELLQDETNEMRIDLEQTVEAFALQAQENSDLKKEMDMLREHMGIEEASKALLEEQLALEMNQLREELAEKEEESRTVERELTNEINHLREQQRYDDHVPCGIDASNSFPPGGGGGGGEQHGSSEDGGIVKQEWILQELNRLWSEVGKLKHEEEEETTVGVPHQHGLDNHQDSQRNAQEQRIHSTSAASLHTTKKKSSGFGGSSVVGTSGGGGSVSTHASSFRTPVSREQQQQGLHPPRHGQGYGQHETYVSEGPVLSPYNHDEEMDAVSVSSRTARSHTSRSRKSHYPDADNMEASVGSRTTRSQQHSSSRSHRISSSRTENDDDMEASVVGARTTAARSHHTSRTSSRALKISPLISEILTTVDHQAHLPSVRGLVDNEEDDEGPSGTANDIDFFRDSDPVVYAAVTSSRSNNNNNNNRLSSVSNTHAADSPVMMMSRHSRAPTRREMGEETRMFRSRSAKGQRSENNRVGGGTGGGGRSRSRDSAERISRRWKQSHLGGEMW